MEITATAGHSNGIERRKMSIFRIFGHKHRWEYYFRVVMKRFLGEEYKGIEEVAVARRCVECYKYEKSYKDLRGGVWWDEMNEEEIKILREKLCMGEIFKKVAR